MCKLEDCGVEAAADVSPLGSLLLGDENLGAAEIVNFDHGHAAE